MESRSDSPVAHAAIALGSNLGDSQRTLEAALDEINRTEGISLQSHSSWYRTRAVGPPQPDYLNGCAIVHTRLTAEVLMRTLLAIEAKFGRVRRDRWEPRTLDLDLLLVDRQILHSDLLQLPHPRMTERAFVLVPLAELAPDWVEPVSGKTIAELVQTVDCSGVEKL